MDNKDFVHLHLHTDKGSILDGLGKASEYAKKAKKLGFKYLGISDHGSIDNVISFQNECIKNNIQPIIGCEAYISPDNKEKSKYKHICIYVKNEIGWRNLCYIQSIANLEGFYRKPRIDFDLLYENCEGLIITTACVGSWLYLDGGIDFFHKLHKKIGDDLYLEVMPHDMKEQKELNKLCLKLHKETGVKLVASNDIHYVDKEDWKIQEVILAIRNKQTWKDPKRTKFPIKNLYLCNADEIIKGFKKQKLKERIFTEAMLNTKDIAKKCRKFKIEQKEISLPDARKYKDKSEDENLKKLSFKGYRDIFKEKIKDNEKYLKRFEMEFGVISEKKYPMYFIILWDLVNFCREEDIEVNFGRGSAAGSLLAYLLKITSVDPIKHKLIFERFLNKDRGDYPDIDLDIEGSEREKVRNYLIEKYGENNISGISTFSKMKGRSALKDVSRVFNVPLKDSDIFAKAIDETGKDLIKKAIKETKEGKDFQKKYPEVVDIAIKIEGTVRGVSQHAGGIIISKHDMTTSGQCNLVQRKGVMVCNWDLGDAEFQGLIKIDLLGIDQLSIVKECRRLIKLNHGKDIKKENLSLDDEKVFKELSNGYTAGVFQINTNLMTKYVKILGIENFSLISDAIALVRPGPLNSGMTEDFIKRKHGEKWSKKHKIYEEITKDTFGVCAYQEQLMFVITKMAGLPFTTADKIRKIIGKKRDVEEFKPFLDSFVKGCIENKTFSEKEANEFWKALEASADYMFNLSHSVSYAMLSYTTAWLKTYFPAEFFCANLTYGADSKKSDIVKESFRVGLDVMLPKVGISDPHKWLVSEGILFAPFTEIKSIGEKDAIKAANLKPKKKKQSGFFNIKKSNKTTKLEEILGEIKAFDKDAVPGSEVQDLFDFPISKNIKIVYPKLYKILGKDQSNKSMEDLLEGNVKFKRLIKKQSYEFPKTDCSLCDLDSKIITPSSGTHNIMIIGEYPTRKEAKSGLFMSDKANNLVFETLFKKDIHRESFYVTNAFKCYSKEKLKSGNFSNCFKHLENDIEKANPNIILSLGNAPLNYILDQEGGVLNLNGTTRWIEKVNSYVCFCVGTYYASISPENKKQFRTGIKNFIDFIKKQGGI